MRQYPEGIYPLIKELFEDPIAFNDDIKNKLPITELEKFVQEYMDLLKTQPALVYLGDNFKDTTIVGDIHGDLPTTERIMSLFFEEKINSLIFLGDYVDRGEASLTVILIVLSLMLYYPERVIALKGNHEDIKVNRKYGFLSHLEEIYGEDSETAIELFDILYNFISVAAITPNGSICAHGGVPRSITRIQELEELPKPYLGIMTIEDKEKQKKIFDAYYQIQWNDPRDDLIEHFEPSMRGKETYYFNDHATREFLHNSRMKRFIRAHEARRGAFESMFNGRLLHIFSTGPFYGEIQNICILQETEEETFVRDLEWNVVKKI